ncbi:MAG: ureidoglycolate lyase [Woeseia sp.]|nr:ureidoglycolate lyase [Woeseia sp.]MBT8096889.1 ureidoglycolate lyase [Woeseia sp.]NNE62208.1 ureidoglycolate lyase [Woeseia sp.]NNL55298.1 ureidoglycolate lyase [Woeseia sp.]
MADRKLKPVPITPERFAPFGDIVAALPERRAAMNEARFERFDDLAGVDVDLAGDGHVAISIARSRAATVLPYRFDMVERHPLGSQAFIPRRPFPFVVVVGPRGESIEAADLQAFVTNGTEGINYHRGTWHMPLISLAAGEEFLIVDRCGSSANCETLVLADAIVLEAP